MVYEGNSKQEGTGRERFTSTQFIRAKPPKKSLLVKESLSHINLKVCLSAIVGSLRQAGKSSVEKGRHRTSSNACLRGNDCGLGNRGRSLIRGRASGALCVRRSLFPHIRVSVLVGKHYQLAEVRGRPIKSSAQLVKEAQRLF